VPPNYFDKRIAKSYEAKWPELFEPAAVDPVVRFLAELAGPGAALELGVGTGRIALPLSRRGVRVHGIDLSPDMVAELRAKPDSDDIGVTIGDFATTRVDGRFMLAYLLRNTIMNLTTPGWAGGMLPERRRPARARRVFRDRGRGSGAAAAPTGRDRPAVHRDPDPSRLRRVRRRVAAPDLPSLLGGRRPAVSVWEKTA
jgi:SAM-dependent methyltransferase